jgi:hypothetical protein
VAALIGVLSGWALQVWLAHRDQRSAGRVIFTELAGNQLRAALLKETKSHDGSLLTSKAWESLGHRVGLLLSPEDLITVSEPYQQIPAIAAGLASSTAKRRNFYADPKKVTSLNGLIFDLGEAAETLGKQVWSDTELKRAAARARRGPASLQALGGKARSDN